MSRSALVAAVHCFQPAPINTLKPSERNKMLDSFDTQTDGFTDKLTLCASAWVVLNVLNVAMVAHEHSKVYTSKEPTQHDFRFLHWLTWAMVQW